ncbi:MAG: hypothetical protein ACXVEI_12650 [Actinomycetota bacterium]
MIDHPSAPRARAGWTFVAYLVVSVLLFGVPVLRHMGSRFIGEGSADAKLYVWDLGWWPHAISSGLNPFHAEVVWAPSGANMAWVTGLPGPALLMFPVTHLFGGVVAFNVLAILAPALAAWAAFLLCYEVTASRWPSLVGGYLFGFSTYEIAQMHGHVNLFLIFPVPLAAYLFVRFARGRLSPRSFTWLFALVLVGEFSISTEVFATMTFFGAIALAGVFVFDASLRARTRELLVPVGFAFGLAAIPLAPYLWYATSNVPPALSNSIAGTSVDLWSFVVPRTGTLIGGSRFDGFTDAFLANVSEDGAYLTPVLMIVLGIVAVRGWRDHATRLLLSFTGLAGLLALGAFLDVRGHRTIPLPWWIFERFPVLRDALPERFTMYMWLGIAVIVARWLAGLSSRVVWRGAASWTAVGIVAVLLLPNLSLRNLHQPILMPPFFADGQFRGYLSPGETIMIIHSLRNGGAEMLWQAQSGFYFRMPQGHTGPEPAAFANDPVWQNIKSGQPFGVTAGQLQAWLLAHGVGAVVLSTDVAHRWLSLMTTVTGSNPKQLGGVVLYTMARGLTT